MKYDIKKLLGWFATASLLLTTSCVDASLDEIGSGLTDEVTVSFVLAPESATASRADGDTSDPQSKWRISDGKKADVLIYAIYDEKGNLIEGYETFIDDDLKTNYNFKDGNSDGFDGSARPGQTVLDISDGFPTTVNITLKRNVKYYIAFWAQSRNTNAYDTRDLKKVEVRYSIVKDAADGSGDETVAAVDNDNTAPAMSDSDTPNNDEMRDVFCRSVEVNVGQSGKVEQNVYLYRPLAQINVGTSGFDFELPMRKAQKKYTYSKIRINRVARYLNVVADETYTSTTVETDGKMPEAFAVVDFGYAPIPAYTNPSFGGEVPEFPSYTKWDWEYAGKDTDGSWKFTPEDGDNVKYADYANEDFLRVKLYDIDEQGNVTRKTTSETKGEVLATKGNYPEVVEGYIGYANYNNHYDEITETFKYLSMCYVLTSSSKKDAVVINNVKVWLATGPNGEDEYELLNIDHVPAQRNWRTNIVGNLLTEENVWSVTLDRNFAGEFNGELGVYDNEFGAKWSGPLAKDVYYDAYADEILISGVDGLLWFQKMVNGKLTVREAPNYENRPDKKDKIAAIANSNYSYYAEKSDGEFESTEFAYEGFKQSDFSSEVQQRILVATKQKYHGENGNDGEWPENGNFHFVGYQKGDDGEMKEVQAKVRLMADIDLSRYKGEWIPIGFDGRIAETVDNKFKESDSSDDEKPSKGKEAHTNRGFFGIFDGGGHTISNLSTKRFSARVHDSLLQDTTDGPFDNPTWFARGLFGMVGGNAKIKNVKLFNVDVLGCQCVGAVVGAAYGDAIEITDCIVNGGSLIATPMYRGDGYSSNSNRTFARGVYLGGIVGYFNTVGGRVDRCEVKNLYMRGYRRAGGIIGSLNPYHLGDIPDSNMYDIGGSEGSDENKTVKKQPDFRSTKPASVSYNKISNTVLQASQFSTFGLVTKRENDYDAKKYGFKEYKDKMAAIPMGFGWDAGIYNLYAHEIVGGHKNDDPRTYVKEYNTDAANYNMEYTGNDASGLTYSEITENVCFYDANGNLTDEKPTKAIREADIQTTPLKYMPILSAWYADEIRLHDNYYGEPSAYTTFNLTDFKVYSVEEVEKTGYDKKTQTFTPSSYQIYNQGNVVRFPMPVPYKVDVDWVTTSPRVGLYVGSVKIDGQGVGGRSVITPTGVQGEDAAVMFFCPENRHQYVGGSGKLPTELNNLILRGEPYAYTGLLLAPNKNMTTLTLNNVAIYDVYYTLKMYDWKDETDWYKWPYWSSDSSTLYDAGTNFPKNNNGLDGSSAQKLVLNDCNLRGYTVPGSGWGAGIEYNNTTFEQGAYTGNGTIEQTYTCVVENHYTDTDRSVDMHIPVTFNGCYFKAPYIIDLSKADLTTEAETDNGKVTFENCYASATNTKNEPIEQPAAGSGITKIVIGSTSQGKATVTYYKDEQVVDKDGNPIAQN